MLIGEKAMEPVVAFVSQHIGGSAWQQRYAAVLSLGIITEGSEK